MAQRIAFLEELKAKFEEEEVEWPFGDGPYEWVWKGETRLYDRESYDAAWGSNVVSGTGETKVKELAVQYRGLELLLTKVDDELGAIWKHEERKAYLLEIVETGKTRKQRAREASEAEERRWKEVARRYFPSGGFMPKSQILWVDLYLTAPRVAEKISPEKLGEWMSDLSWGTYVPNVKDVLERLHEFGLPAELALPEPPAPKMETPEEKREHKAHEKFGTSFDSLKREEKLWVLYWVIDPVKAEKVQVTSIKKWMSGKGSQPLTGQDVQKAVQARKIQ